MNTATSKPKALIICGPTASGKSSFAMDVAHRHNGSIINADSMQIYNEISIITASPSKEDKTKIPHYLYNYIAVDREFSVGKYIDEVLGIIKDIELPIIVGGTGLYISALLYGLSNIPDINPQIRRQSREEFIELGAAVFYKRLIDLDPSSIKLRSSDSQRMMRSYEVLLQTGNPISYYQDIKALSPLAGYDVSVMMLNPERSFLHECCEKRFRWIVQHGALDEARMVGDIKTSAQKALGLQELQSYLRGDISLEEAINLAVIKTRQYAKRQVTWFNNQIHDKEVLSFGSDDERRNIIIKL